MFNFDIWVHRFQNQFIPDIIRVKNVFLEKIPPIFSSVEVESKELEGHLRAKAEAQPSFDGEFDAGDIAQDIEDAVASFYCGVKEIEQGLLNTGVVFLYQLYEQHLVLFLRQGLLSPKDQRNAMRFSLKEAQKQLLHRQVDVKKIAVWGKLEELQLAANVIKHGEGRSCEALREVAPHLFGAGASGRVYTPLLGDGICVKPEHIIEYVDVLIAFWTELGEAIRKLSISGL